MNSILKIATTILISALFLLILLIWDGRCNNQRVVLKLLYTPDCDYRIQQGYRLVQDTLTKRWAIKIESYEDYFIVVGKTRHFVDDCFSSIVSPTTFYDSCMAKRILRKYVEDRRPTFNSYK